MSLKIKNEIYLSIGVFLFYLVVIFSLIGNCKKDAREIDALLIKKLFEEERYSELIEVAEKFRQKYPESESGYLTIISSAYLQMGEIERAKEYIKKAIDKDPSLGENHANLGVILFNENNFRDALPWLLAGLKKGGYKDPCALVYSIAISYSKLGDAENASGNFLAFNSRCGQHPNYMQMKREADNFLINHKTIIYKLD